MNDKILTFPGGMDQMVQEAKADPAEMNRYEFTFMDGTTKISQGYLINTSMWAATGRGDRGEIQLSAPWSLLKSVELIVDGTEVAN